MFPPNDANANTETVETPQAQAEETLEARYSRLYTTQNQETRQSQEQLLQAVQALQNEVTTLRSTPQSQQIVAEPSVGWVERIRQGDFEGAQRVIAEEVQRSIKPQLEQVRQEAYQQAINATTVNLEMDRYLNKVRSDNPELAHFERYLNAPVAQRVELAKSQGRVKNGDDLVREYKAAVDAEVAELRNLGLQFRAAGKTEALTRNREVLSSTPLQPQQVQSQTSQSSAATPQAETTDDYFARRKADEQRRHGLTI